MVEGITSVFTQLVDTITNTFSQFVDNIVAPGFDIYDVVAAVITALGLKMIF